MTRDPNEWLPLYTDIIREIKLRVIVIDTMLSDSMGLGPTPRCEFCHLELRMICELIAISTLVAHGDIAETQTTRMQAFWEADKILSAMSKLRSDFFPVATALTVGDDGKTVFADSPFLIADRQEITSLYRQCGRVLHRGSLGKYEQIQTTDADFEKITDWASKFMAIADGHLISGHGPDGFYLWFVALDDEFLPIVRKLNRIADPRGTEPSPAQQDTAPPETETPAGDQEA